MGMDSFWLQNARELVDCAMGRLPAHLVVRNGKWVCVQTGEIIPNIDIAMRAKRIAYVGPDASHTIGKKTIVIDAQGKLPGARAAGRAHARGIRAGDGDRVRARGAAARHHRHVHRPA